MYHIAVLTKSKTQETFYRELMLRATDEEGEAAAHSSQKDRSKAIKCFELHTVKQTEKQYSFIVRRFLVETANFSCKDETANAQSSPKHRVQCNLNAILIFRQKSLTPSLNGRSYTVLYENFAGV